MKLKSLFFIIFLFSALFAFPQNNEIEEDPFAEKDTVKSPKKPVAKFKIDGPNATRGPLYPGDSEKELISALEADAALCMENRPILINIEFIVNVYGKTEGVVITKSNCETMNVKVIAAIEKLKNFKPALQNGTPVPVKMKRQLSFE